MNEMIERAAFAAQSADSFDHSRSDYDPDFMDVYRDMARAMIEAIRTPTDAQRNAYYRLSYKTENMFDAHWERAIDAILYETPEDVA